MKLTKTAHRFGAARESGSPAASSAETASMLAPLPSNLLPANALARAGEQE